MHISGVKQSSQAPIPIPAPPPVPAPAPASVPLAPEKKKYVPSNLWKKGQSGNPAGSRPGTPRPNINATLCQAIREFKRGDKSYFQLLLERSLLDNNILFFLLGKALLDPEAPALQTESSPAGVSVGISFEGVLERLARARMTHDLDAQARIIPDEDVQDQDEGRLP